MTAGPAGTRPRDLGHCPRNVPGGCIDVEDGTCVIRAELPGIDPEEDVDLSVVDGVLHLAAQREEKTEEDRPDGYRSEFHYGHLVRNIRLPEGAQAEDVTATYRDGILEVRVLAPQDVEATPPTRIPIERR